MHTDESRFWAIIEQSDRDAHQDVYKQAAYVRAHLSSSDETDIRAFSRVFEEMMEMSYTQIMLAAATVIFGHCPSDDNFDDFRAWLIGRGRRIFNQATEDPDALASVIDPENAISQVCGADLLQADWFAFTDKTGMDPKGVLLFHGNYANRFGGPDGETWAMEELPRMLPRLWRRMRVAE